MQIGTGGPTGSFGAGAITFGSGSALILDVSSNLTVNSPMTFASGVTIKQMGTGTTVLNNVTSYSAATTVSAGTLELNSYFGTLASGSVSVSSGTTFALGPNYFSNSNVSGSTTPLNQYLLPAIANLSAGAVALSVNSSESINFSNTGTFAWSFANLSLGAVGSVTYSGTFTPNGTTYRFGGGGGTLTFASTISGSGSLLQMGAGTTILSGPNTFSGTTTLSAGNLEFNSYDSSLLPGSITVGAGTAVAAGSAFISGSPSGTLAGSFLPLIATSSAGTIALAADNSENLNLSSFNAASLGAIGAATYNGTLTPNGSTYRLGGGGGTLTFAGAMAGTIRWPFRRRARSC